MEEDTLLWTKFALRRSIRERLKAVSGSQLQEWSADVASCLQKKEGLWQAPGTVALFGGLRDEPDLISYFLPWVRRQGWRTVLFGIRAPDLLPYEVTCSADLERGALGAWEPVRRPQHEVAAGELSLILTPGLAFSEADGTRLGRGGGYYDRFLANPAVKARRIGVAFEMQVAPTVPCEPHDSRVHELVTEKMWRVF
ncbi:MAG: 5-formyltetrahydrofolate cyclo-ligase [Prosthecobacter sp.]|nr:5-formyltetrahydrofolate cyclo-ligase [Prosthecobacter sp.]